MVLTVQTFLATLLLVLPMEMAEDPKSGNDPIVSFQERTVHAAWDGLLKKHVKAQGKVDYRGFTKDRAALEAYLDALGRNPISEYGTKDGKLAYYINLYNAATVKLVLDNYPLKSIKDLKKPWDQKFIKVGNKILSLGEIEHDILRKMEEPRIHFAINCASSSCPDLLNEAFVSPKMEQQLEKAARNFINDPRKNKITAKTIQMSELFKWYKKDFTTKGSLKDYINKYSDHTVTKEDKYSYLRYDWTLNE